MQSGKSLPAPLAVVDSPNDPLASPEEMDSPNNHVAPKPGSKAKEQKSGVKVPRHPYRFDHNSRQKTFIQRKVFKRVVGFGYEEEEAYKPLRRTVGQRILLIFTIMLVKAMRSVSRRKSCCAIRYFAAYILCFCCSFL
eukprot:169551_1